MNVSLTPALERMVEEKVASGTYASASEVVREALRLLGRRDARDSAKLEALRAEIRAADEEIERGEGIPGAEAMARARKEFRQRRERGPA